MPATERRPCAMQVCFLRTGSEIGATRRSGLDGAQVYSGLIGAEGADRTVYDPAIGRSDHASFQDQGFPSVVVSEDFFMNTASETARDRNPHYHRVTDTAVNGAFGARIACAVARAVREMAEGT